MSTSRAQQGLPEHVCDKAVLARVAALLLGRENGVPAGAGTPSILIDPVVAPAPPGAALTKESRPDDNHAV